MTDRDPKADSVEPSQLERELFVQGPTIVFRWAPEEDWPVRFASPNCLDVLGYSVAELEAGSPSYAELVHPDDLIRVRQELREQIAKQRPQCTHAAYRLRRADRSFIEVADYTRILYRDDGSVAELLGYLVDVTQVRAAEARLKMALEATGAGFWEWEVRTGTTRFDDRWAEIVGYAPGELDQNAIQTWQQLCHPEDLARSDHELQRLFAGEVDVYECEVRVRHKDGSWVWVRDRGKILDRDADGTPLLLTGTHTDITELKRSEAILAAERNLAAAWSRSNSMSERLGVCLDTVLELGDFDAGGIYLVDPESGDLILEAHRGLSEAFVESERRIGGNSAQAGIVKNGVPLFTNFSLLRGVRQQIPDTEDFKALAVLPVPFEGRGIACINLVSRTHEQVAEHSRSALERIAGYIGSFIRQEMREEEMRHTGQNLDALFNSIEDFLFVLDAQGRILRHNEVVARRLGYPDQELVGQHVRRVHPRDRWDDVRRVTSEMLAGNRDKCTIPLQTSSGELIPVETAVTFGNWEGQDALFGISRDIRERLRLQDARIEMERRTQLMQKSESLARMAGAVAHHFNNMLLVTLGNLELSIESCEAGSGLSELLGRALESAQKASEMSSAMLLLLGQHRGKRTRVDLGEFLSELLGEIAKTLRSGAHLLARTGLRGLEIEADRSQLRRLFEALIENAIEALGDEPGDILVQLEAQPAAKLELGMQHVPPEWSPEHPIYAQVIVRDSGCGMEAPQLEQIFDPFYSSKFTGRGLGLALALGIVRPLGGCIGVRSEPGQGSEFHVRLPLISQDAEAR
jgi:PAS domain S-box-containing protein